MEWVLTRCYKTIFNHFINMLGNMFATYGFKFSNNRITIYMPSRSITFSTAVIANKVSSYLVIVVYVLLIPCAVVFYSGQYAVQTFVYNFPIHLSFPSMFSLTSLNSVTKIFVMTVKWFEPVKDQDSTVAPARHMWGQDHKIDLCSCFSGLSNLLNSLNRLNFHSV